MGNRNSIALRPLPAVAPLPHDDVTVGALQRWCADRNAQVIFNCDGTIYAAVEEELRHSQYSFVKLTAAILSGRK